MSAGYLAPQTRLESGRAARVSFELRNGGAETWPAGEGFGVGYHLFDAETGTLIVDGARTPLARPLAPGESARVELEFALPPEPGRYYAVISPMREGECWYYEKGWPFLVVEARVENEQAFLEDVRVTNQAAMRRRRALRAVGRAFTYPALTIWRNRGLIRVMVRRDVLGRYRGSFGGSFWTVFNPLLLMLTYFFVFGLVLRSRFGQDSSRSGFALYFLAAMLPWLPFSEAVGRAPTVILEHRNFVKKLVFSIETLPVNLVAAGLITEAFAIVLYCVFLLIFRHAIPATALWLPALLVPQILFTLGLSWFLAALGAYVRDLGQIIGYLMTIWFFLTPICYPESSLETLPHFATLVLAANPMYVLVRGYRAVFLEGQAPAFGSLWKLWLAGAAMFVLGHAWFYKLRKSFADII
jgi:lipopolysaccharide transport system permease protein